MAAVDGPASDKLCIQNLPPDITEETISQIFAAVGYTVAESQILRGTGQSTCEAMVRFASLAMAQLVRTNFDGTLLPGFEKPLQIRYASSALAVPEQPFPQLPGLPVGGFNKQAAAGKSWPALPGATSPYGKPEVPKSDNLYIKGLPPITDEAFVRELFGQYAVVTQCKVMKRNPGEHCHALVRFGSLDDAVMIKSQLNGGVLEGTTDKLIINFASNKKGQDQLVEAKGASPLGKGGKNPFAGADPGMMKMLNQFMAAEGGKSGGGCKGAGAYDGGGGFGKGKHADDDSMQDIIGGLRISGILPGTGAENDDDRALHVQGLPPDCEERHLYQLLAPFGCIVLDGVEVKKNWDGSCSGDGFVHFVDKYMVQAASEALNGAPMPDGATLQVMPKKQQW